MEDSLSINESEEIDATGTDGVADEASPSGESAAVSPEGGNVPGPQTGIVFLSTHSPRHTGLRPHFLGPRRQS
jgi:hypothetical protein